VIKLLDGRIEEIDGKRVKLNFKYSTMETYYQALQKEATS
jgi:prefoldin subunit 5